MSQNPGKFVFLSSVAVVAVGVAFAAGLYSGVSRNIAYKAVNKAKESIALVFKERENLVASGVPIHFLQPARHDGAGVTVNDAPDQDSLVLISGYFGEGNELRLMRRDGTIVAQWPARFSEHFPDTSYLARPPATDRNLDIHGALMMPDGSVVFNYEYYGSARIGHCGDVQWTLKHESHHSVERSEKGGFWVPGRARLPAAEHRDSFPPFTLGNEPFFLDDLILRVSEDGEILEEQSLMQIMFDNGLEPVLTATGFSFVENGISTREFLHLNKIAELPAEMAAAFPGFEAGDLALSIRDYNLIVVLDPDTWAVKWHQVGPWRRQHDPEWRPDGTIAVFNNNTYRFDNEPEGAVILDAPMVSNIVTVNPATGETQVVYGEKDGEEFLTVVRGKHDFTPGGGLMITEFQAGRVFEVDTSGKTIWEYINRFDDTQVVEVTEGRAYPASYFDVTDWSCP